MPLPKSGPTLDVISGLEPGDQAVPLSGGLWLRMSSGNGMVVIGCSRVDEPPSETEIKTVVNAVARLFSPVCVLVSESPVARRRNGVVWHVVYVVWPRARYRIAWQQMVQGTLM